MTKKAILVSDWTIYKKLFYSENIVLTTIKLCNNDVCLVLLKNSSVHIDQWTIFVTLVQVG